VQPFGLINALKPPGPSSTSFGAWVRKRLGSDSLGHWGTLDPAACGVLVLAVGRAARLLPYLKPDDKSYVFELRVGTATDTADATGVTIASKLLPMGWADGLEQSAASLVGPLDQLPPMYSAVKIDGKPLYKSARAGRAVERAVRRIHVHALRVLDVGTTTARIAVDCSAGTYVRTLCEQIGERLGLPSHLGMLLRTASGPFRLADASTPSEIERDAIACLVDPLTVLDLAQVQLDSVAAQRFLHGNAVQMAGSARHDDSVLVLQEARLIGIGRASDGMLVPVRVLASAEEKF
jgi:tRNA pseudouridine55 synthase